MLAVRWQGRLLRVAMQLVGQTARLGAKAAVCRAAADKRRHEALTRIANAQGTVREGFDLHAEARGDLGELGYFGNRQLARQRDALGAQTPSSLDAGGVVRVHLRRNMQARAGNDLGEHARDAYILHDEGIGARLVGFARKRDGAIDLGRKHLDVERHIHAHAAQMRVIASGAQVVDGEVVGVSSGIELAQAKINGVGTGANRRAKAFGVARRSENLDSLFTLIDMLFHERSFLVDVALASKTTKHAQMDAFRRFATVLCCDAPSTRRAGLCYCLSAAASSPALSDATPWSYCCCIAATRAS